MIFLGLWHGRAGFNFHFSFIFFPQLFFIFYFFQNIDMLILKKSCFIHIPKTGGSWVKQALIRANIEFDDFCIDNNVHIGIKDCPYPKLPNFVFVRHPVAFYKSYWQLKMTCGWDENNLFDMEYKTNIFHNFVIKVTRDHPGIYGNMIDTLIGDANNEIEFVGRQESLAEDLIIILRKMGEDFDEHFIRTTPLYNVSDDARYPALYNNELKSNVMHSERYIIERFYSDSPYI